MTSISERDIYTIEAQHFQFYILLLILFRMVNRGIVNALSKFERQILSYTSKIQSLKLFCFVFIVYMCCIGITFNQMLIFLLIILFINILIRFIFSTSSFVNKKCNILASTSQPLYLNAPESIYPNKNDLFWPVK